MPTVQVRLPQGIAEGSSEGGVKRFFSLPYAAPLTDARRFRAPEPPEPWTGVRDATRSGPCAPQNPSDMRGLDFDVEPLMGKPGPEGPDYLTLDVIAPETPDGPRPVMLFIHGGGFVAGSKDAPIYDGTAFARDGVVYVGINYRLGIEGWLPVEGAPTNIGLRDMIAALHWVRQNIALFGGDPGNVTLFGESGGAWCISTLIVSPLAKGLFHRAICMSGHAYGARPRPILQRVVNRLARMLKVDPTREGFLSRPMKDLLAAQLKVTMPSLFFDMRDEQKRDPSFGITRFLPVYGDDVLPEVPLVALEKGAGREIDLLIGTTSEEARLFTVPVGLHKKANGLLAWFLISRAIPRARQALIAYGLKAKGAKPGEVMTRAWTDLMFRAMTRKMAGLHAGRSYVYEFDWRSPAFDGELGAAHAIELPFAFDTLACASGPNSILDLDPPQGLADHMHALWIRFATDGTAPWPQWDGQTRQVYSLTRQEAAHEPVLPAAQFLP